MAKKTEPNGMASFNLKSTGWQLECWNLAKANKSFEVKGFKPQHELFFSELCAAYNYETRLNKTKAVFYPLATLMQSTSAVCAPYID